MPHLKEYFQRVANIAQFIVNEVNKFEGLKQYDAVEWTIHMGPNYFTDVIPDDGSLLLNATDGLPANLHTPLGGFNLGKIMKSSEEKKNLFMQQLIKRLGLVEILPKKTIDYKSIYEKKLKGEEFTQALTNYGPIYAITLDLDGKPIALPKFKLQYDRPSEKKTYSKQAWDEAWKELKPDYNIAKEKAAAAEPLNPDRAQEFKRDSLFENIRSKNVRHLTRERIKMNVHLFQTSDIGFTVCTNNIALNIILQHLPTLVAIGKQNEADAILSNADNRQELLMRMEQITDCSGRSFHCSLFEYAYWAKDIHMCRMLLRHMNEQTKAYFLKCCENIEANGLMYEQNGRPFQSSHFSFAEILSALEHYLKKISFFISPEKWMKVGEAQRNLPAHVINEYCRPDRSFDPLPSFKEDNLPRTMTYYSFKHGYSMELFPIVFSEDAGLGVDFALARQPECAMGWPTGVQNWIITRDSIALRKLDLVRTEELVEIRHALKQVNVPRVTN